MEWLWDWFSTTTPHPPPNAGSEARRTPIPNSIIQAWKIPKVSGGEEEAAHPCVGGWGEP